MRDLAAQQRELADLVTGLGADGWERPTPCPGWAVADVVLHLAQTDELAAASASGRFPEELARLTAGLGAVRDVDEAAGRMVARDRAAGPAAIHDRWRRAAGALRAALRGRDPAARVRWVAGVLTARTLATTRLAETWIHTCDVAEALGRPLAPSRRLHHVARLAWRTIPYAFARAGRRPPGPVAFELTGPGGERWAWHPDGPARTTIRGDAFELCRVAARRVDPARTALVGEGPDAAAVLELVRTYA
ncbi:MAG: TIGR03084 family protein [Acidimicrobiia bacterium]|nr:MAG: TIGR03084 family protein [Acidimicrobiia bacterium]